MHHRKGEERPGCYAPARARAVRTVTANPESLRDQVEDEQELRATGPGTEVHLTADVLEGSRPSVDRQDRIGGLEERSLDVDLPASEEVRPGALPPAERRADQDASALVVSHDRCVARVVELVAERQLVSGTGPFLADVHERIGGGMLDDPDRSGLVQPRGRSVRSRDDRRDEDDHGRDRCGNEKDALHPSPPFCPLPGPAYADRRAGVRGP